MKQLKNGLITTNVVGPDMNRRAKTLLTTLIVLTITAICVVGFVLVWDVCDLDGVLDELMETNIYGSDDVLLRSDIDVKLSMSGGAALPESERLLIENYFTCYYASLGSFYHENMSRFYGTHCVDEIVDELALDFEINAAKNGSVSYSFDECSVSVYVLTRKNTNEGTIELSLLVSSSLSYKGSPLRTELNDESHVFILPADGEPLITEHRTDRISRKYAELVINEVTKASGYQISDLSYTYFDPFLPQIKESFSEKYLLFSERISVMAEEKNPIFTAEYPYDFLTAADFARKSYGHSEKFGSYDENDVNFCSQCLIAGGIPMDAQGDKLTQWKWYGYEENNTREHWGCTKSWFDRYRFWTYASENNGFGLVAEPSEQASAGDIIQLLSDGEPILQCMVTGIVLDNSGKAVDYYICTDKIKNKPLSLFWNGDIRILSVIGYNTANI